MSRRRILALALLLAVAALLAWLNWPHTPLAANVTADRVLVEKDARRLSLFRGGALLATYKIALGRNPLGAKSREGDGRTPEGMYVLDYRKADSAFHRALHISYPAPRDLATARAAGVAPGGLVMIHGLQNGLGWIGSAHRARDWTDGCIAVTNDEIEEIFAAVPDGTPIEIRP